MLGAIYVTFDSPRGNDPNRKLQNNMKTSNEFRTSDIRLSKDSQGMYEASHKAQGYLYDWSYFDNRTEARRAAVDALKDIKENGQSEYDIHNDY